MAEEHRNADCSKLSAPADPLQIYRQDALEAFSDGIRDAGIDFAVFLPDRILDGFDTRLSSPRQMFLLEQ